VSISAIDFTFYLSGALLADDTARLELAAIDENFLCHLKKGSCFFPFCRSHK
jgi:hypothetical protein